MSTCWLFVENYQEHASTMHHVIGGQCIFAVQIRVGLGFIKISYSLVSCNCREQLCFVIDLPIPGEYIAR